MKRVLYTAAHHGFGNDVPLGGGAAVCHALMREWLNTKEFPVEVLDPSILGESAPQRKDLVRFGERAYADFCVRFEHALTDRILREDPKQTAVLINDICEGPDFWRLSKAGFSLYTIYHVDVVDYVARMYLRGLIGPESLTRGYARVDSARLRSLLPEILRLILPKQQDSVMQSRGVIVPSEAMKEVIKQCYPKVDPQRIHVIPWGVWGVPQDQADVEREKSELRLLLGSGTGITLLMLSRISPEKRQDRLLEALRLWEECPDYPSEPVTIVIAGEAAYMHGLRFEKKLRAAAARLRRTRVFFVGYASGARKEALFELADLYVFPSEHESYGLTLLEAMRHGLPVLACANHGTQDIVRPEFGMLVSAGGEQALANNLLSGLKTLSADRSALKAKGEAARGFAAGQRFSEAARRVGELVQSA